MASIINETTKNFIDVFLTAGFQGLEYALLLDLTAYLKDLLDTEEQETIDRVYDYLWDCEDGIKDDFKARLKEMFLDDYNVLEGFFAIINRYVWEIA
jgi:hypothetical protein